MEIRIRFSIFLNKTFSSFYADTQSGMPVDIQTGHECFLPLRFYMAKEGAPFGNSLRSRSYSLIDTL